MASTKRPRGDAMASVRLLALDHHFPVIDGLLDRRGRPKTRSFVLVRALEIALWGDSESARDTASPPQMP